MGPVYQRLRDGGKRGKGSPAPGVSQSDGEVGQSTHTPNKKNQTVAGHLTEALDDTLDDDSLTLGAYPGNRRVYTRGDGRNNTLEIFTGTVDLWKDYVGTQSTEGFFWALRDVMSAFDDTSENATPRIVLYITNLTRLDCTDPSVLFASIPTIWDCLTLAAVSLYTNESDTSMDQVPHLIEYTDQLGVDMLRFQPRKVLTSALSCVNAACSNANCTIPFPSLDPTLNASQTVHDAWLSLHSVCDNTEKWVANPDIIGPGVLISYMSQVIMGVLSWAIFALCSLAAVVIKADKLNSRFPSSFPPSPRVSRWLATLSRTAGKFHETFLQANPIAILQMSVVEFQEAQCFFVMATQFAIFMARRKFSSNFSSNTSGFGFFQDENSATLLAVCGVLPMVLTQATLARCGRNPIFTLVLSSATLGLSFAARKVTAPFSDFESVSSDQLFQIFDGVNQILECGGRTSPRTFCGTIQDAQKYLPSGGAIYDYNFFTGLWIYLILLFILLNLWAERLRQVDMISSALTTWISGGLNRLIRPISIVIAWMKFLLELVIAAMALLGFKIQVELFGFTVTTSSWGIGQFVAAVIFAPVIYKWIFYTLFRIKPELPVSQQNRSAGANDENVFLISAAPQVPMEQMSRPYTRGTI
ncbi:hypothetical protein PFICI_10696 [Pestalotiopsis fici W106-1]|uniref:Uncharacterized protein n=1 Tax=Pestalotiopsis fici (strain W106-1 / CGMCC3.15140) TaxID=1229662 RepID=W3WXW3_PESFW|nr:uncharacterized protein PFICI_10696 [Pestalotiopsis fici W106-1]ETS78634.1 hypothetical protein PFICI_10696 [Pestalotiopsis fici W106-1]